MPKFSFAPNRRLRPQYLLACLLAAAFPLTAFSATDNWTNTAGGNFNTGGNWSSSPTVPGSADIANFNLNNTYTVTFTNSPTNLVATVQQGNVTWNANGTAQTYTDSNSIGVLGGGLTLGSSGALLTVQTASLTVEGSNASLTTKSDSSLTTGNIDLAADNQVNGNGTITDSSTITQLNAFALSIGSATQGVGILNVTTGGTFNTSTGLTTINATGHLNLTGGIFNLNGNLTVNRGNVSVTGGGLLWNNSNTTITIQSAGHVNLLGTNESPTNGTLTISGAGSQLNDTGSSADIRIDFGTTLTATSGASVSTSAFDIGFSGVGAATFDGANTTLTASTVTVGTGATGTLTLSNSATGSDTGLFLGSTAGSNGTLNIKSNAILSSGSISVATSTTTAVGTINVNSGGALSMTPASTLTIGATGSSLATVTIAGGTLSTSTSLTTINPTGQFYLNTGTLNLNGNLTVTSGFLTQQATATFNWAANHTMTIQSGGNVTLLSPFSTPTNANITITGSGSQLNLAGTPGGLTIANGAQVNLSNGSSLSSTGSNGFDSGTGSLIVDNSFLNISPGSVMGDFGTFSLTLRNNATANVSYAFVGLSNGSSGTVNVQTGANLSIGGFFIGFFGQGEAGTVNLSGGSITMTPGGSVTVGAASNSSASLTISGGTFNTDPASTTTINATGVININGGTLNQTGDITLNGGSLTESTGSFTWAPNHTMLIQSGGVVSLLGAYFTPAGATINVTGNGSQFNNTGSNTELGVVSGSTLSVTSGGSVNCSEYLLIDAGTITIDGTGSSLIALAPVGSGQTLLGITGSGSETFSNSASGSDANGFALGLTEGSSGTLIVESSATLTTGPLDIADQGNAATGVINVTGGTLTQSGTATLTVGQPAAAGGTATITIGPGGSFNTGTGLTTLNATGQITLNGGTFNQNGDITVTGGSFNQSAGTFTWAGNHTMNIQNGGLVRLVGGYILPTNSSINITNPGSQLETTTSLADLRVINGASVSVSSGGLLHSDVLLDIGNGTVSVDGTNSSITTSAPTGSRENFIGNGATSSLTLSNGSIGSVPNGFRIGAAVLASGTGTLNVLSGASLSTGPIDIASGNDFSVGTINVTGGSLTQIGAATLTVGSASFGSANLTIGTAGVFTTGPGLTAVLTTGVIHLTGGTLNENADITLTGGAFTQTGGIFSWATGHTMTIQSAGSVNLINTYTTPANAVITIAGNGSTFSDTGPIARLTIDNGASVSVTGGGSLHSDQFLNIGQSANATVTVDGANSSLTSGNAQSILGNAGTGSLTFSNSATGSIPSLRIGSQAGSSGTLNVQSNANLSLGSLSIAPNAVAATGSINVTGGATLTMTAGATLSVGAASLSSATITLDTGGNFITSTAPTTVNATGQILILNGTFAENGNITLNGGALTQNGGLFNWAGNRTMTIQSGGTVSLNGFYPMPTGAVINISGTGSQLNDLNGGDLIINGGATLSVTTGASVDSDGFLDIASISGDGAVTIDGANSSLTTGEQASLLGVAANGTLTFSNHASGTLAGYDIGTFFGSAGNGTLNVFSNATVTVTGAMNVGTFANFGDAFINVTGGSLTQTNSSTLTIGAATSALASVSVGAGGTYSTSTALTTINPTGQLSINGGTFNLNGDLTVTGGSLSQISGNFHWTPSHTMTIQSGGLVSLSGAYITPANSNTTVTGANSLLLVPGPSAELAIDFGATLSITNGGTAHSGQFLAIADTGNGNVTVDGANSSLSAAVSAANGINSLGTGGTGSLSLSNNSTGSLPGGLEIGFNTGSIGILNVSSNASLTTGTISIANSGLNAIGIVTITGGTVTQTGNASLIVGDLSGSHAGAATLTIGLFGTLATGSGPITIAPTGTLNDQAGGNFLISGNVTNAGNLILAGNHSWAPTTSLTNTAGKTTFTSNGRLFGLSITGGTIDITSTKLIIETTPATKSATLATLQGNIANGSLLAGNLPPNFGLALVDNAALATPFTFFGGNPVDLNSLLLAPELLGDSNLDGHVDLTDLNTVLNHLGVPTPAWTNGNFDHAPTIDLTDLNAVLNHLGTSIPNPNTQLPITNYQLPLSPTPTPTPEPTSLLLLTPALLLRLSRRPRDAR